MSKALLAVFGAGLIVSVGASCAGPDRSRNLGCERFASAREAEICRAMSESLRWRWAGHATLAPGFKPTLESVAPLACRLGLSTADVGALQALRDASPPDWRREALASWLLGVVGAGGASGTMFDPASSDFVLKYGCPGAR